MVGIIRNFQQDNIITRGFLKPSNQNKKIKKTEKIHKYFIIKTNFSKTV